MTRRLAPLAALLLLLALGLPAAHAGGPRPQTITGSAAFAKGTLEGLALDADGVLRPGPVFEAVALDCDTAWAGARSGDALWIGTGNAAELLRVAADGTVTRIALGPGLMVTAVAPLPEGAVAAAVFPGGRIVKVLADGTHALHARLAVEHVWALASDARGALAAACGVPGCVVSIDPFGAVTATVPVDDEHARCLAVSGATTYVGTAPKGQVLALDGEGLRVVHDLEPQEVVGLVPLLDGSLLIAANTDEAGGNAQALAALLRQMAEPQATKPGKPPAPREALQDGSLLHLEKSGVLTELWSAKKTAVLGLAPDGQGAVAGTYPSGRVVRVEPGAPWSLLADLPEAEASVVLGGATLEAVVTSNPAVLHRRGAVVDKGTWTSAPLDADATSLWGRITLWGAGVRSLQARGGETSEPDASWSAWQPVAAFDGQSGTAGLRARFVQVRATLEGKDASLRTLVAVAGTPNRAPTLSDLVVGAPGGNGKKDAPPGPSPLRKITWKAADADEDRLRTTVEVNRRDSPQWTRLVDAEELAKAEHVWDTTGMPDGIYQVAVTVEDGPDNEPGRARSARRVLAGVRVDNTPPTVTVRARRHGGGRLRIEGEAQDPNDGRIVAVRVSIDGGDWIPLGAQDAIYDSASEAFEGVLRVPDAGAYDVVVQVTDAQGNLGAAATVVR